MSATHSPDAHPGIRTKSIGELIDKTFFIPDYQRGYRWEESHVEKLLDDLISFLKHPRENDSYCLQPIVVCRHEEMWEVIDGQQRLTTLKLLLSALQAKSYEFTFAERGKSEKFLKAICQYNNLAGIDDAQKEKWQSYPDFCFMKQASEVIEKKGEELAGINNFAQKLCNHVKVIWYQVNAPNARSRIKVFERLNIGKIPLTNAELVKALLLTEVKKGLPPRETHLRQAEMAYEWYNMEKALQKDEFWAFLNNNAATAPTRRMDILLSTFNNREPEPEGYYTLYSLYEQRIKNKERAATIWREIKHMFAMLNQWYADPNLYNKIGFLITRKEHYLSIHEVFNICRNIREGNDSTTLEQKLNELMRQTVERQESKNVIKPIDYAELSYNDHWYRINDILLLFNIAKSHMGDTILRFPFERYHREKWSLEHIHARNSQAIIRNVKSANDCWDSISKFLDLRKNSMSHEQAQAIKSLLEEGKSLKAGLNPDSKESQKRYQDETIKCSDRFMDIFGEIGTLGIDSLANLALLPKDINSSLNDSVFPEKRLILLKYLEAGRFVPPCTLHVFFKTYTKNPDPQSSSWDPNDQSAYIDTIKHCIESYLTSKPSHS